MSKLYETTIRNPADLKPYPGNAKKHSPAQVAELKSSIERVGWIQPVVVDTDDVIIIGHGRVLAAIQIGKRIPVLVFQGTKIEAAALRISDNAISSKEYDMNLFKAEVALLAAEGWDMTTLSLTKKELDFTLIPLEIMDESAFVDDIQSAVESQRSDNDERAVEIDASTAPLADAFGFRRMTVTQSRRTRAFMTRIEAETEKKGPEALMVFFDNLGVS